ncbi:MAG TPA: molybdopterin-dependent oxidoreductase [Myxococcota bacterium]|nr:molybdopterin-dependent oxidoreductase [Myxococcota bacterium]
MPEVDRREFLKIVGAGAGAAAVAGCSDPVQKLIPYVIQPEEITPGIAVYYASTCQECSAGCGLHVRTREGRPIKLEGNPDHPINQGALCARGQTSLGRSYHPDRFKGPMKRGADGALQPVSWDEAIAQLAGEIQRAGGRTWVLGGEMGPTASRWLDAWIEAVGAGGRAVYEPLAPEALRAATKAVFGVSSQPLFDLSGADLIVDFGSDFLETGASPVEHARQLVEARDAANAERRATRFVYVGPRLSMTASNADEWLAAKPGTEGLLALALARVALAAGGGTPEARAAIAPALDKFDAASVAAKAGVPAAAIERLGQALAKAKAPVALPPGAALASRRATATTGAVLLLDWALGALGKGVKIPAETAHRHASYHETLALVDLMKGGKVGVLLVHGANPSYSLPPSAGFKDAVAKVPFVVSFASAPDETTEHAHLVLPDHTPMESWGDAEPRPGVRSLVQPTLRPLYDTRAFVDTLLDVGRAMSPEIKAKLPEGSFRALIEQAWSADGSFREALALGGRFADVPLASVSLAGGAVPLEVAEPLLEGEGDLVLLPVPSLMLSDGRGANLPWLQEIPDPVTKVAWQSHAEISPATAQRLGVAWGDVLKVETGVGSVELPAVPRGGVRDDVIAIAIGQGHRVGYWASRSSDGYAGEARGVNVIDLLPAATDESGGRAWLAARARVTKTGAHQRLPLGQTDQNQRKRRLGLAVSLVDLAAGKGEPGGIAPAAGGEGEAEEVQLYDATFDSSPDSLYRWGMSVDVDRCTGCNACIAACYIENNVPVVGEEQMRRGRWMSWLRIERWVGDGALEGGEPPPPLLVDDSSPAPDIRNTPQLCQQCGAAPCEPVCPVIATYHNEDGLNGMIYNRCIGTRYCSNNCPYKVRRFNWFDFALENWPEPLSLMANPDVTMRGQGVMEKCTFCVQRIAGARQKAKDQGRPIADGEVTTACAQSCPTHAITFGNLKDKASAVSKRAADAARGYHALQELNTRPAITYLAKVTRGPVEG